MHSGFLFDLFQTYGYGMFYLALLPGIFWLPLPEDVVIVAAGWMAGRGVVEFPTATAACIIGVVFADFMLVLLGRLLGPRLSTQSPFNKVFTPKVKEKIEEQSEKYGGWMVLMIRLALGFRPPLYMSLGAGNYPILKFVLFDLMIAAMEVTFMAYLGYVLGAFWEPLMSMFRFGPPPAPF